MAPDDKDLEKNPEKQKKEVISVYAAVIALVLIVISFFWNFIATLPSGD